MPSFDIVSEVDQQEVRNAVDQTNREVGTRFDFKGSDARVEQSEYVLSVYADAEFQLRQVRDILESKLVKRGVDIGCIEEGKLESISGNKVKQDLTVQVGLDSELAKKVVKLLKGSKIKVQAQIQGDEVRVSGKKRDDLQEAIQLIRSEIKDFPLQYKNFRD